MAVEQAISPFNDLRNMLEKAAGIQCSSDDIHHDEAMTKVVLQLNALGASSQFGNFQVGHIAINKAFARILLPGPPPTLIKVPANSRRDKIIELLRSGDGMQQPR